MSRLHTPPFEVTPRMLGLVAEIMRLVGRFEGLQNPSPRLELRRSTRARTLLGSLAIEGNTLTLEQATAVLDGEAVIAPSRDVLEFRNALAAYGQARKFHPAREADFLWVGCGASASWTR